MDLEAGTYYIEIAATTSGTGVYNLRADFSPAGNNDVKPNSTRETAQTITSGQTVKGFISYQNSNAFYKVVLPQSGRLTLEITGDSVNGPSSLLIKWIDSNGVQIKSNTHAFSSSKYTPYMDLEAGTYYIEIVATTSGSGVYNLKVQL
jgi:hypothetical protein